MSEERLDSSEIFGKITFMLRKNEIRKRLAEMGENPHPKRRWDETCAGSARSMVIFLGPSPGGTTEDKDREIHKNRVRPRWDEVYDDPLSWSAGFRKSFVPMVEGIFDETFDVAGRLVGRANLDWISVPDTRKVSKERMRKGLPSVLKMVGDCQPDLIVAMGWVAYRGFRSGLREEGYSIEGWSSTGYPVVISEKPKKRIHRKMWGFKAVNDNGDQIQVIKLPQHPARILNEDYARRCGEAVRKAAVERF